MRDGHCSNVPPEVRTYLDHIVQGTPIRAIARREGCHPSTVLRRIRKVENARDDMLIDAGLDRLATYRKGIAPPDETSAKDEIMQDQAKETSIPGSDRQEALRILGRLSETGACLALAEGMENAVVVRDDGEGSPLRTAVVPRALAEWLALQDWIAGQGPGRIRRYRITAPGRAALKRFVAEQENARLDDASTTGFADQHRRYEDRHVKGGEGTRKRVRYNAGESPMVALARRKDKSGKPFLERDLVAAGERFREDFETAQMGPRVAQNWDRFLTGGNRGAFNGGQGTIVGPESARKRISEALADLGPGLGDIVLRCCCFLEGLEETEQEMGWSARSGKIVLRIALQRLRRHYDEQGGKWSPLIG